MAPPALPYITWFLAAQPNASKLISFPACSHLLSSVLGIHPSIHPSSKLLEVVSVSRQPAMSRGNNDGGSGGVRSTRLELQLQLNLSPPVGMEVDGGGGVHDDSDSSSPSSCVSSDGSPGGKSPMVIGACTRCLMYCMVAKKDYPTCINCKQPCLVDLLHGEDGGGGGASEAAGDKKQKQQQRGKQRK